MAQTPNQSDIQLLPCGKYGKDDPLVTRVRVRRAIPLPPDTRHGKLYLPKQRSSLDLKLGEAAPPTEAEFIAALGLSDPSVSKELLPPQVSNSDEASNSSQPNESAPPNEKEPSPPRLRIPKQQFSDYGPLGPPLSRTLKLSMSQQQLADAIGAPPMPGHAKPILGYRRRRTDNFPMDSLHSAPTVASSSLTASTSANDLSQPDRLVPHFQQYYRTPPLESTPTRSPMYHHGLRPHLHSTTPTRIPTPTYGKQGSRRYVSTPVLPSEKKENRKPQEPKTLRLLGPISPTRNQPALLRTSQTQIPKSRTMNMISSLTSSISRSNLSSSRSRPLLSSNYSHESSSKRSYSRSRSTRDLSSIPDTPRPIISSPLPSFTINGSQVYTAQPNAYWSGRFQSLTDRFHQELCDASLLDPILYKQYVTAKDTPEKEKGPVDMKEPSNPAHTSSRFLDIEEEDVRSKKRAFAHLEAQCVTRAAKQSLWEFQQMYARIADEEDLLPIGGRLHEREGWVSRLGKAVDTIAHGGRVSTLRDSVRPRTRATKSVGVHDRMKPRAN